MNTIVERLTGLNTLSDEVIAYDLLNSAKTGVRNYAIAVTEAATPEVRTHLRSQLQESIALHGEITDLMMNRGWYHPYHVNEQINLDVNNARTALNVAD